MSQEVSASGEMLSSLNQQPKGLTEEEIQAEMDYRYEERLGILCGSDPPTPEQIEIATSVETK